jgi:serine/threonine protein kinase
MRQATDQVCKLSDLMLAKAVEGAEDITRPGELLGELEYLSPERTRGVTELDARSDLYGLGATAYALLTGRPPFDGATAIEKITKIRQHDPVRPTQYQASIPTWFEAAVLRLLAKKPADRHQSVAELVAELTRTGRPNAPRA